MSPYYMTADFSLQSLILKFFLFFESQRSYKLLMVECSYFLNLTIYVSLKWEAKDLHADMQANRKEGGQNSAFPLANVTGCLGKAEETRTPTQPPTFSNGLP